MSKIITSTFGSKRIFWIFVAFLVVIAAALYALNHQVNRVENLQGKLNHQVTKIATLQHKQDHTQHILRESEFAACHRLNILRVTDNNSHWADYKYFTLTTRLIKQSLKHPTQPETQQQKVAVQKYLKQLESSAKEKTWIPITKCNPATDDPLTYKVPKAIPFYKHLPPKSALTVPIEIQRH